MPILLAVGGSNAIQTLRIDSNTVSVWDKAFQLAVTSLRHNSTLRTLSLAHWTFDLQDKHLATLYLQDLLTHSKLTDLNLTQCTFDLSNGVTMAPTLLLPPLLASPHPQASPQHHGTHWGAVGGAGGAKNFQVVRSTLQGISGFFEEGVFADALPQEFPQPNPAGPVVITHAPYHTRRLLCHHLLHSALNAPQESA
ncbi:hypothetical protein Pcinc_026861 [Petrolisthes cinctipes]|uniref:Uncharacterized protein n=1 Tax=Petrolisthes cinctipes TaxID=88211 RepID=A0AAE1F630_PETCI|nr:hypothetical protein Pcinc_026861 [Petrolisthes cinctipes]